MADVSPTIAEARAQMLAALSAAGCAVSGMADALRVPEGRQAEEVFTLAHGEAVPLEDEVFAPLFDAIRLAAKAVDLPTPLHRVLIAIERFNEGDD